MLHEEKQEFKTMAFFPGVLPILGMVLPKQCPLVIVKASLPIMEGWLHGSLYPTPVLRVGTPGPGPGAPDQHLRLLRLL